LDEWAQHPLTAAESRDPLEIIDDRYQTRATLIASQLPVERWHDWFPGAITADPVLDGLVHHAYRVPIQGASMRKVLPPPAECAATETTNA